MQTQLKKDLLTSTRLIHFWKLEDPWHNQLLKVVQRLLVLSIGNQAGCCLPLFILWYPAAWYSKVTFKLLHCLQVFFVILLSMTAHGLRFLVALPSCSRDTAVWAVTTVHVDKIVSRSFLCLPVVRINLIHVLIRTCSLTDLRGVASIPFVVFLLWAPAGGIWDTCVLCPAKAWRSWGHLLRAHASAIQELRGHWKEGRELVCSCSIGILLLEVR